MGRKRIDTTFSEDEFERVTVMVKKLFPFSERAAGTRFALLHLCDILDAFEDFPASSRSVPPAPAEDRPLPYVLVPRGEDPRSSSGEEKEKIQKKKRETRLAPLPISEEVIGYLNEQAGPTSKQKPTAKSHRKLIQERLDAGATVEDLKTVIRKMCAEWADTKMAGNLKPSCLFRASNFDGYLGQPEVKSRPAQGDLLSGYTEADWYEGCDNAPGKEGDDE